MAQLTFIRIVACSSQWMLFADTGPCEWHNRAAAFCFLSLLSPSPSYLSSSLRVYRPTRHVVSKFTSRSAAFAWVIWYRIGQLLVLCGVLRCCGCCVVFCGVAWCLRYFAVLYGVLRCRVVFCDVVRCLMLLFHLPIVCWALRNTTYL